MKRMGIVTLLLALTILLIAGCGPSRDVSEQSEAGQAERLPTVAPTEEATVREQRPTDTRPQEAEPTKPLSTTAPLQEATARSTGGVEFGKDPLWPDYIPAAIPVLPGKIENVLAAPQSHVRLFYGAVSEQQIEEYLALLREKGFKFEYQIYIQEGFPDNSEERRSRGEYDAIEITMGDYRMTLSHGEGRATYDIYTSGFKGTAEASLAIPWPSDLEGVLPPPERCELVSASPNGRGGHHVACKREDEDVDQHYFDLLVSQGFQIQETFENSQGEITLQRLRRGDMVVELSSVFGPHFTLDVSLQPLPRWPEVFDALLPRPARCELSAIIPSFQDTTHVTCELEDKNVLPDYVSVLEQLGFTEQHKSLSPSGEIMIITLSDGSTLVDLTSDAPDIISVRVSQPSP
jgi:hypothetical protein